MEQCWLLLKVLIAQPGRGEVHSGHSKKRAGDRGGILDERQQITSLPLEVPPAFCGVPGSCNDWQCASTLSFGPW